MSNKDKLAAQRTDLAVDRTLLAYIRTFLTIIVAGASLIKFFSSPVLIFIGWTTIPFAVSLLIYGVVRCKKIKVKLISQ